MKDTIWALAGALLAALSGPVTAQPVEAQDAIVRKMSGFIEAGASHHSLSSGLGTWNGEFVRGTAMTGNDTWRGDLWHWKQYGDEGTSLTLTNTHVWNAAWHTIVSAAGSSGGFFLPRVRIDGFVNRTFLADRSLVVTLGAGYVEMRDVHEDHSLFAGATYYATPNWILNGGVRYNRSDPAGVESSYQHLAATYGRNKDQYLTARYASERESYQLIGPTNVITDFWSHRAGGSAITFIATRARCGTA
jgi:YaiO family outer membrane protein